MITGKTLDEIMKEQISTKAKANKRCSLKNKLSISISF